MFLEVPSSGLLNNDDDEDDENCLSLSLICMLSTINLS